VSAYPGGRHPGHQWCGARRGRPRACWRSVVSLELFVAEKQLIAERVASVTLRAADGADLPEWQPGSHIDLYLPGGLIRQYSLCSDPADRSSWRLGVLKELSGRGGSDVMHDAVQVGDVLTAVGPKSNFAYQASADDVLFIAGGIGVTPLLGIVSAAERTRAH